MLGLPYIKFIYILSFLNKINKKILCFIVEKKFFIIKGVNQQETLLSNLLGFPTHPRPPTPAPLSLLLERGAGYASALSLSEREGASLSTESDACIPFGGG